jgi:hypothetical protein
MAYGVAFASGEARVARVRTRGAALVVGPLRRVALPPAFWQGSEGAHLTGAARRDLGRAMRAGPRPVVSASELDVLYQLHLFPRTARPNLSALVPIVVGCGGAGAGAGDGPAIVTDHALLEDGSPLPRFDLVVVAAARREMLARLSESVQRAGVRARQFVPATIGLLRFARRFLPEAKAGVAAVIAVEETASEGTLVVLRDGSLLAARELRLPAGVDSATQAGESLARLVAAVRALLEDAAHSSKRREVACPSRVLLLGRRGPLGDVAGALAASGLPRVDVVDARARLAEARVRLVEADGGLSADPAEFAVAIGLALPRERAHRGPSLRLVLPRARRGIVPSRVRVDRPLAASAAAAAAAIAFLALEEAYSLSVQKENSAALLSALRTGIRLESQLLGIEAGQKLLSSDLAKLHARASSRAVESRFREFVSRAPHSVKITRIELRAAEGDLLPDSAVSAAIHGIVQGRPGESETARIDVVRRYVEALEQVNGIGTVKVREARPHRDLPDVESFELHVGTAPPGARP